MELVAEPQIVTVEHKSLERTNEGSMVRGERTSKRARVLFLCTANAVHSPMAEAILRHVTGAGFDASSAGLRPEPFVHPEALWTLEKRHVSTAGLKPKALAGLFEQRFDYVITLCDRVLESCPVFPHADMLHWSFRDPTDFAPSKQPRGFDELFSGLMHRIRLLVTVDERRLDRT